MRQVRAPDEPHGAGAPALQADRHGAGAAQHQPLLPGPARPDPPAAGLHHLHLPVGGLDPQLRAGAPPPPTPSPITDCTPSLGSKCASLVSKSQHFWGARLELGVCLRPVSSHLKLAPEGFSLRPPKIWHKPVGQPFRGFWACMSAVRTSGPRLPASVLSLDTIQPHACCLSH